jgi:hypothetical protein
MIERPELKTDYEVFNYVKTFLLKQNKKSLGLNGDCQYLGIDPDYRDMRIEEMKADLIKSLNDPEEGYEAFISEGDEEIISQNLDYEFCSSVRDKEEDFHMRCAVGCLIDIGHYSFDLEGKTFDDSYVIDAIAASNPSLDIYSDSLYTLLQCLQKIHDSLPVEYWGRSFLAIENLFDQEKFIGKANDIEIIYGEWQKEKQKRYSEALKS